MGIHVQAAAVGVGANVLQTSSGGMVTKAAFGTDCSIMVATRDPGYHSRPHRHRSEQVNYVVDGEVWAFVEDEAFLCRAGDFFRIPANAVHWAWNRSDAPISMFEAFSPVLDPYTRKNAVSLLAEGEESALERYHETERLDPADEERYLALEQRWLATVDDGVPS
jgi:quercetin dioxygenase-like cupin family protein